VRKQVESAKAGSVLPLGDAERSLCPIEPLTPPSCRPTLG
jgi:hypothetical protein